MTAVSPTTRPADRSTPPVTRIKAAPSAIMALVEDCCRISRNVEKAKKLGSAMAIPITNRINTIKMARCIIYCRTCVITRVFISIPPAKLKPCAVAPPAA
ncbi:hypothetical protein D1872_282950 [compost metagenome]